MNEGPENTMHALHTLRKSRDLCLNALVNFRDHPQKTKEDCDRICKVVETYINQIADPLSMAFEKKMQRLVPKINEAVTTYEKKSGSQFSQDSIEKALLNESTDDKLNNLLHPFYDETIQPKHKIDNEIKTLKGIVDGIKTLEKKL